MSYVSTAEPIKIGYLIDFRLPPGYPQEMRDDFTRPFELVFKQGLEDKLIDRPVQIVTREVEGLPKGTVKAVIDAFGELVDEGCLLVFGPHITDNAVPTREAIEQRFRVPAISVTGTEDWLGEWTFAFPQGSLTDEPIFWADLLAKGRAPRGRRPGRAVAGRRELRQKLPARLPAQGHPDRGRGVDRANGAGRQRAGAQLVRRQGRRDRALRLRTRGGPDLSRSRGARLGSAPLHRHRLPERLAPPHHVERTTGLDRHRPVRRGQPRRPALPRPVSRRRTGDAPSTACRW